MSKYSILDNGVWGYRTDPVGTAKRVGGANDETSIWDTAYGTDSASVAQLLSSMPVISGEGSVYLPDFNTTVNEGVLAQGTVKSIYDNMQLSEQAVYERVMNLSKAKTHGYMKNLDTGEIKKFQFNPETLEYSRGVEYADVAAPGLAYPYTQFVRGNAREFKVELFLYARLVEPSTLIKDYMNFIGGFLTPEENTESFKRPPEMLFFYGYFARKCVLTDLNIVIDLMDENGTPTMAHFTLTLRQVGVV